MLIFRLVILMKIKTILSLLLVLSGCTSAPTFTMVSGPPQIAIPPVLPPVPKVRSAVVAPRVSQPMMTQIFVARRTNALPMVTLVWNAVTNDPTLVDYNLWQGAASLAYTNNQTISASVTTCTFSNLAFGTTYYFAATAIDADGLESSYSSEVTYTTPTGGPLPPGGLMIQSFTASALPGPWVPDTNWPPVIVSNPMGNQYWNLRVSPLSP